MPSKLRVLAARLRIVALDDAEFATVVRGAGLALAIRGFGSVAGYVSLILLARWMGHLEYGYYVFAIALMTLLAIPATLGLPGAAVRFVSHYQAIGDWSYIVGWLRTSSWLAVCSSSVIAILALLGLWLFGSDLDRGYLLPTIVALAGTPVVALGIVRSEAIRGLGLLLLAWGPFRVGQPVLLLLLAAAIFFAGHPLSATIVTGASVAAYAIMLLVQYSVLNTKLGTRLSVASKTATRHWLATLPSFLGISLAASVLPQAPIIVIGFLLAPADVAVYSAAAATASVVSFLLDATSAMSSPRFAALHASERHGELRALFATIVRRTFWPSLLGAAILIAFGSPILGLFGPGFERGYWPLVILTIGHVANAGAGPIGNFLSMTGHHQTVSWVLGVCACLAVLVSLVLTPLWGILGTAIAFSGAMILWNAILWTIAGLGDQTVLRSPKKMSSGDLAS